MRNMLLAFVMLCLGIAYCGSCQAEVAINGNNITVVKSSNSKATETSYKFTDAKGNTYPVMKSVKGKYFIVKTSAKTGKEYRQYLPANIQEQLNK